MNISKNISSIRESKGIKQYQVAELLGIEPPNYSRLEKRGDKLTIEQLEKIATALGVSVKELLFGEKEESKEDTQALKSRIVELESIIRDKEEINTYLFEKHSLCKDYLKEVLDFMFDEIAVEENNFGELIYQNNGREKRIRVKELTQIERSFEEDDEIVLNEIRYEFTENEIEQTLKILFTSDRYKTISGLIMWTGTIDETKYVRAFKKYIVQSNLTVNHILRFIKVKDNPLGLKGLNSTDGLIFE